jgi:hypothetical protein
MDIPQRNLLQDYEEERAALEAQAKAYDFYAGLISRATSSGAKLPVWDATTADRYRELAARAKARIAELDRLIAEQQQERTPSLEELAPELPEEPVAATPAATSLGQEPLAAIPSRPPAGWLHTPRPTVHGGHGSSAFRYRPGLHEFTGSVAVVGAIAVIFLLTVYGIMIYESLFVLPHLAP